MKKIIVSFTLILAVLFIFAACSAGSSPYSQKGDSYPINGNILQPERNEISYKLESTDPVEGEGQKLTVNATVEAETKDFAVAFESIKNLVNSSGGYVSSSSQSDMLSKYGRRKAEMTLRVPSDKFEEFMQSLGKLVSVTSQNTVISDITESYYSAKSSYDSLLIQEERLLSMLEKADKLSDMLTIEDKLADVRQKIQYYETQLKTYDNKVSYSTVSLSLSEVVEYTDPEPERPSFWSRISDAFKNSWENFGHGCQNLAVWIVEALPALVVIAVIALVIVIIVKSAKRNRLRRQEAERLKIAAAYAEKQKKADETNQD